MGYIRFVTFKLMRRSNREKVILHNYLMPRSFAAKVNRWEGLCCEGQSLRRSFAAKVIKKIDSFSINDDLVGLQMDYIWATGGLHHQ